MRFNLGWQDVGAVEVINRQQHVEYKFEGDYIADEREVRAAVGNVFCGGYAHTYSGEYFERKPAIKRMERDIAQLKQELVKLEFALKVTKKKNWKAT